MMKKFYVLTLLVALTLGLTAQQLPQLSTPSPDSKAPAVKRNSTKATEVGWFIPAWDLVDNIYGGGGNMFGHYANVTFCDSTVQYISGGNATHNWLTSFGYVLDPYSDIFLTPVAYGAPYYIDSIFVLGWYEKVAATASYVDTLVFEFVWGERDPLANPPFRSVFIPGADTMYFAAPSMNPSTAQFGKGPGLTWPGKEVIKYPLTMNDTTLLGGKFIEVPVNLAIPAACLTGVNVTFVPGYPYNFGDTIYSYGGNIGTKNSFRVGLYATDDPTNNPDLFYDPFDYFNLAYYINNSGRYGLYTNTLLNQIMYPLTNWGFDVGFKVSINAGIDRAEVAKPQIYPNPASTELNVRLSGTQNAHIQIIDLVGKVVKDVRTSQLVNTFDISDLSNGVYLVRVQQGNNTSTTKLVVR